MKTVACWSESCQYNSYIDRALEWLHSSNFKSEDLKTNENHQARQSLQMAL